MILKFDALVFPFLTMRKLWIFDQSTLGANVTRRMVLTAVLFIHQKLLEDNLVLAVYGSCLTHFELNPTESAMYFSIRCKKLIVQDNIFSFILSLLHRNVPRTHVPTT